MALGGAGPDVGGARPLQDRAGGDPFELLPAIDPPLESRRLHIARRRHGVAHPARELEAGRGVRRLHLGMDVRRRIAAHRPGVQVAQMRQVHEIVDHQHVVGLDGIAVVLVGPMGLVVVVGEIDDQRGVGVRPHRPSRSRGTGSFPPADSCARARCRKFGLPRDRDAPAAAVEGEAVIAALDAARHELAVRQGSRAVAAAVHERGGSPLVVPEENDRLVADAARQRLLPELVRPGRNVPSVANEHRWLPKLGR